MKKDDHLTLLKYLQAQGIGSRRLCRQLIAEGEVALNGTVCDNEHAPVSQPVRSLHIGGQALTVLPLPYYYILMHKPAGYETSHRPRHWPSVFSLLPEHIRATGIQAVGRLDADTTGVLLLTNDGQFNHRMTSPKHHMAKHYRATLKHPATHDLCAHLQNGVLLHDDNQTVAADHATLSNPTTLLLTLREGKYHQVKRMVAAAGNRVIALHRERFDIWTADDLAAGQWRFVFPQLFLQDATHLPSR